MAKIITKYIEAHVFRKAGKSIEFLLLKRAEGELYANLWQMVSGKIKPREKAFKTALREIKEETGLTPKQFWTVPNINSFYNPTEDYISLIPVFAALVNKDDRVSISSEHSEYKWVKPLTAKKMLAWEGQRKSVELITDYFLKEKHFLGMVKIKMQ